MGAWTKLIVTVTGAAVVTIGSLTRNPEALEAGLALAMAGVGVAVLLEPRQPRRP